MSAEIHPRVEEAASGRLPEWARATSARRAHMARVAELLEGWAHALELDRTDVLRWRAAGFLHDALRDADPEALRDQVPPGQAVLPGPVLHGPAAARRLREDGMDDDALLRAVAYHTLGHPELDRLGRALYVADFLEPGRTFRNGWRRGLRERMPGELGEVVREVLAARITHQVGRGGLLLAPTVDFWNVVAAEG